MKHGMWNDYNQTLNAVKIGQSVHKMLRMENVWRTLEICIKQTWKIILNFRRAFGVVWTICFYWYTEENIRQESSREGNHFTAYFSSRKLQFQDIDKSFVQDGFATTLCRFGHRHQIYGPWTASINRKTSWRDRLLYCRPTSPSECPQRIPEECQSPSSPHEHTGE